MKEFDWCSIGKYYNGQSRSKCTYGAKMKAIYDLDKQRNSGSQVSVPNTGTNEQQKSTESQSDSEKSKTEASKTDNNPKEVRRIGVG